MESVAEAASGELVQHEMGARKKEMIETSARNSRSGPRGAARGVEAITQEAEDDARRPLPEPLRREGKSYLHYPKELKLQVVMEALQARRTQAEIGEMYGIPQSLISHWKKAAVESIRDSIDYRGRLRKIQSSLSPDAVVAPLQVDSLLKVSVALRETAALLERSLGQGEGAAESDGD